MVTELVGPQRLAENMDYDTREDVSLARHRMFAVRFREDGILSWTDYARTPPSLFRSGN